MIDLVFDGSSLYARCWYASARSEKLAELSEEMGTSYIEIGVKMVLNILNPLGDRIGRNIDRMLFCWDGQAKREKRRLQKPEGYEEGQEKFIQAMKDLFGSAHCRPPSHEADDAVATYVYRCEVSDAHEIYVVSGDKDLQQLATRHVHYYDLNKSAVLLREDILRRWHVKRPSQICVALAILGDPGDNVLGVHGWGEKRVEKLFQGVELDMTLDRVVEYVESQLPHELLNDFRESLDLTVLDPEVPKVPDPLPLSFASWELVKALGFRDLAGRYMQIRDLYEVSPSDVSSAIERF